MPVSASTTPQHPGGGSHRLRRRVRARRRRSGRTGADNAAVTAATAPPLACTVAGSDCSGAAGIQADLLAFAACGVAGATVVTALTAQDHGRVHAVEPASRDMVARQMDAVAA